MINPTNQSDPLSMPALFIERGGNQFGYTWLLHTFILASLTVHPSTPNSCLSNQTGLKL